MEVDMGIYIELNNFEVSKRLIFIKTAIKYKAPDYSTMIQELRDSHDMTAEKIAFILPVSGASSVSEWARGGIPYYEVGEALLELWKTLTNKTDEDIPRLDRWSV